MADVADLANEFVQAHLDRSIHAACVPLAPGVECDCENRDEDSLRLVNGLCASCREPKKGYACG